MSQIAAIFKLKRENFNLARGLTLVVVMFVPLIVLIALHKEQYFLSLAFAALLVGLAEPGGQYSDRLVAQGVLAVAGALLTALGFGIGGVAWGWVVLAVFVVTLAAGLAVKYGLHRFAAAYMLNVWFVVAITLPGAYQAATSRAKRRLRDSKQVPDLHLRLVGDTGIEPVTSTVSR